MSLKSCKETARRSARKCWKMSWRWFYGAPKNHGIPKLVVWISQNLAIQIQTPPLEGPMILRVVTFWKKQNRSHSKFFWREFQWCFCACMLQGLCKLDGCHDVNGNMLKTAAVLGWMIIYISSWWLNHHFKKYYRVELDHFANFRGKNKKPLSCHYLDMIFSTKSGLFQAKG